MAATGSHGCLETFSPSTVRGSRVIPRVELDIDRSATISATASGSQRITKPWRDLISREMP